MTCKTIKKSIRKRRRVDDSDSEDESGPKETSAQPAIRRRRLLTPLKAQKIRREVEKSEEVTKFEISIAKGQWRNVLALYAPALKRNFGILEDVDLNLFDSYGLNALHAAVLLHDTELVLLLLKQGARYDIATLAGWTTFHLAASNPIMIYKILDFISPKRS